MRIYIPATLADLAADEVPARRAHAFTPALARALGETDPEAGEYEAMLAAAADALGLLATRFEAGPLVRVVIAADVDDAPPAPADPAASAVLAPSVRWDQVVAFHVDDPSDAAAQQVLGRAVGAPDDDEQAAAAVELDLLWYDAAEREELLGW